MKGPCPDFGNPTTRASITLTQIALRYMHNQAFSILEYDQLRTLIHRSAQTPMGKRRMDALVPFDDLGALQGALSALAECIQLKNRGITWAFNELSDPGEAIGRLGVEGAALAPTAILEL